MDVQVLDVRLELIYNNSVWIQDEAEKTGSKQWMIEMNGEREFRKSVLASRYEDGDDILWTKEIRRMGIFLLCYLSFHCPQLVSILGRRQEKKFWGK